MWQSLSQVLFWLTFWTPLCNGFQGGVLHCASRISVSSRPDVVHWPQLEPNRPPHWTGTYFKVNVCLVPSSYFSSKAFPLWHGFRASQLYVVRAVARWAMGPQPQTLTNSHKQTPCQSAPDHLPWSLLVRASSSSPWQRENYFCLYIVGSSIKSAACILSRQPIQRWALTGVEWEYIPESMAKMCFSSSSHGGSFGLPSFPKTSACPLGPVPIPVWYTLAWHSDFTPYHFGAQPDMPKVKDLTGPW